MGLIDKFLDKAINSLDHVIDTLEKGHEKAAIKSVMKDPEMIKAIENYDLTLKELNNNLNANNEEKRINKKKRPKT